MPYTKRGLGYSGKPLESFKQGSEIIWLEVVLCLVKGRKNILPLLLNVIYKIYQA